MFKRGNLIWALAVLLIVAVAYFEGKEGAPPALMQNPTTTTVLPSPPPPALSSVERIEKNLSNLLLGNWPPMVKGNFKQGLLRDQVKGFNAATILSLLTWLQDQPTSADRDLMVSVLLERLGQVDPAQGLVTVKNLPLGADRTKLLRVMLLNLADKDPELAVREWALLDTTDVPAGTYGEILQFLAAKNPSEAATLAQDIPPGSERNNALASVGSAWAKVDPQGALQWAANLPEGNGDVFKIVLTTLARTNPQIAIPYLDKLDPGTARNGVIGTIASSLAFGPGQNPAAALNWLNQVATGTTYNNAVADIFRRLSQPQQQVSVNGSGQTIYTFSSTPQNIPNAISLLDKVTDPTARAAAITTLASNWSQTDTKAALAWAQTLTGTDSATAQNSIVANWAKTDPVAAATYIENSGNTAAFISSAPALALSLAASDPQGALAFSQSLPEGTAKTQALTNVLDNMVWSNLTDAWTYANNLPAGDSRDSVLANMVGTLSRKDPAQAAGLLEQLPAGDTQINATTKLATAWVKQDPQAFTSWLDTVPAGDVRDAAITQLVASAQATKNPDGVLAWVNTVTNPDIKAALLQKLQQAQAAAGH